LKLRATAVILKEGSLLLIHRIRDGKEYYVLPGGSVEEGETPVEACLREAKEETNLDISVKRKLTGFENRGRSGNYFLCKPTSDDLGINFPEAERISVSNHYSLQWIPVEKILLINIKPERIKSILFEELNI